MKLYVCYGTWKPAREAKRLTGDHWVPVLVADDGSVVQGSKRIVEWAEIHPATAGYAAANA